MQKLLALFISLVVSASSFSQDIKTLNEKIAELEKRILLLEKRLDEMSKPPVAPGTKAAKTFTIRYEVESDEKDKDKEFLITYWDKDQQPRGAWAKSGWKFVFTTTDINHNIQIQGKSAGHSTKKLTVKIYVDNKLVKTDSKSINLMGVEGPYAQVILSELSNQ